MVKERNRKRNSSLSLMRQMAAWDANYIRLMQLLPRLPRGNAVADTSIAASASAAASMKNTSPPPVEYLIADLSGDGPVSLRLEVLESHPYTSTVRLTQKPRFMQWLQEPTMIVRLYHDAAAAEVIAYQDRRGFQSEEKLQLNLFLGEWLNHCLQVGRSALQPCLSPHT